jgi:hypothetical protein
MFTSVLLCASFVFLCDSSSFCYTESHREFNRTSYSKSYQRLIEYHNKSHRIIQCVFIPCDEKYYI